MVEIEDYISYAIK